MRQLLDRTVAAPVNMQWYGCDVDGHIMSDANVVYIMLYHNTGGARNIQVRCIVDGATYTSGIIALGNLTRTWIYLDEDSDTMVDDVNVHLAGGDVPWYGHSVAVEFRANQAGLSDLQCQVRYQQL
jgi:hypothetical protein